MKFSGVKCLAIFLVFIPLALAEKDTTKDLKLNATTEAEDGSRFIKKKILPCVSKPTTGTGIGTGGVGGIDTSGLTNIFTMFTSFFTSLTDMFDFQAPDFSSLTLPGLDINSLTTPNKDKIALDKFAKFKLPAIFFLSLIVGAIAAAIVIAIPSKFQPDQLMHSMMDTVSNFMQTALNDVPAQYGIPSQDYSHGYSQQGYQQQQGGYPQQDSGYSSSGYPAAAPAPAYGVGPAPAFGGGAPASFDNSNNFQGPAAPAAPGSFDTTNYQAPAAPGSFDNSNNFQGPGAPAAFDNSNYQTAGVAGAAGAGAGPAAGSDASFGGPAGNTQAYNAPPNAYPDLSIPYGTPNRRYNYPSLSTNYLRSEKSRK
ncbi:unnamed protein product [Allacma fusca]|uniref:Uncharacterized protein n=1 Tax=Allacma fusca TaxID=39272 RepID=A0A8J2JM28_9HEXA|nr:unnamed protein product [Allacma fusca]